MIQMYFVCMLIYSHAHLGLKIFIKISNFQCLYICVLVMYVETVKSTFHYTDLSKYILGGLHMKLLINNAFALPIWAFWDNIFAHLQGLSSPRRFFVLPNP
jgi:hypothetical protein